MQTVSEELEGNVAASEDAVRMILSILHAKTEEAEKQKQRSLETCTSFKDALTIAQNERNKLAKEGEKLSHELVEAQRDGAEMLDNVQREHKSERVRAQEEYEAHAHTISQQLAAHQQAANTRIQAQAAQMEHMQDNLNEMLKQLEKTRKENLDMSQTVQEFSQRVQGEEASRKIMAAQTAQQEIAISSMQKQRNDLHAQLSEANNKLEEAARQLLRANEHRAQTYALEEQLQHVQDQLKRVCVHRDNLQDQQQHVQQLLSDTESRAQGHSQQAKERQNNMERALFDTRQVVAVKDKKIAHLEYQISRASAESMRTQVRRSTSQSPQDDPLSVQIEPWRHLDTTHHEHTHEQVGSEGPARAGGALDWLGQHATDRPSRRVNELRPEISEGDREISNRRSFNSSARISTPPNMQQVYFARTSANVSFFIGLASV